MSKPKRGQFYRATGGNYKGQIFMVAEVLPNEYCLVSLNDGDRLTTPTTNIDKIFSIYKDRMERIHIRVIEKIEREIHISSP